jgi:NADH-quinone oxidoreductase subunit L
MPVTAAVFAIGGLALAGIPLLVGFFSKDQVLAATYEAGRTGLWIVGLIAAGLTAAYIARAYALTFEGAPRRDLHPHEAPALMTSPMGVLAGLSIGGGLLGLSVQTGRVQSFLAPVFGGAEHAAAGGGLSEGALSILATLVAVTGVAIGWFVYGSGRVDWVGLRDRYPGTKRALESGFFLDDTYGRLLVMPGKALATFAAFVVDARIIDGAVNGLGRVVAGVAAVGRKLQTGLVRTYALAFLLGAATLLLLLAVRS